MVCDLERMNPKGKPGPFSLTSVEGADGLILFDVFALLIVSNRRTNQGQYYPDRFLSEVC